MNNIFFRPFPRALGRIGRIITIVTALITCVYLTATFFLYVMLFVVYD